jgi:Pvc16 N-terminal domain
MGEMSSPLSIASVTSVIKSVLENGLVMHGATAVVGELAVTAMPPDRITTGADERSQLNIYLYRITPNTAWRAIPSGSAESHGARAVPLSLDLHYLLTAYGERDYHAETLLGSAMELLHQTPVLTHETIAPTLASLAERSGSGASVFADVIDSIDQITLSPEFLSMEDLTKLWSALQARFRLSATYQASVLMRAAPDVAVPSRSSRNR